MWDLWPNFKYTHQIYIWKLLVLRVSNTLVSRRHICKSVVMGHQYKYALEINMPSTQTKMRNQSVVKSTYWTPSAYNNCTGVERIASQRWCFCTVCAWELPTRKSTDVPQKAAGAQKWPSNIQNWPCSVQIYIQRHDQRFQTLALVWTLPPCIVANMRCRHDRILTVNCSSLQSILVVWTSGLCTLLFSFSSFRTSFGPSLLLSSVNFLHRCRFMWYRGPFILILWLVVHSVVCVN